MNNGQDWDDGKLIRIFGHGTLSGDKLPHPSHAEPPIPSGDDWTYDPIYISGQTFNRQFPAPQEGYHNLGLAGI